MDIHQSVASWAQPQCILKDVEVSGKLEESNSAIDRLALPFMGTGTDRRLCLSSKPVHNLKRIFQPPPTSSRSSENLIHQTSAAKGLAGTGAPSFQLRSSRILKHASWYFTNSQRPNLASPPTPRFLHQRLPATKQNDTRISTHVDWQSSKALKFVTFTSVPFLLYALAFASGYEPLIQPLTPGSWDKASDAGQHIFSNFPLWCLHASCASLYICSTLLQFNFPGTLRRHASLHRVSGYVFLMCGGCLSVTGLVMAPRSEFPGFAAPCLALSVLWLGCGGMALWTIKRRLVTAHEKWVVRTMAAGYASILSRPAIAFVHFLTDSTYRDSGTPGLWLAMIVAMTSSELLLKHLELQVRSQELAVTESEGPTDRLAHAIDPQEVRTSK